MNGPLSDVVRFGIILARVALWMSIFTAILYGLFTFPIFMVGGFILMYILVYYVRHTNA